MAKATVKSNPKATATIAKVETPKADHSIDAETIEAVKEAFKAAIGRDVQLSDNVIGMAIERDKDWDGKDDDAKLALIVLAETTAKTVMVADPGITVLVKKITSNAAVMAEIDTILSAERKKKQSAVSMLAMLYRIFTQAEMDDMPMPGYDVEHAKGTKYRPDKRSIKTKTGDPITVVWTNDLADSLPQGKKACDDLDDVAKATKDGNSVPRFKGKTKSDLADIKSFASADRNALRSLLKRAIKLHHRFTAIKAINSVGIRWIKGDKATGIALPTKLGLGDNIKPELLEMVSGSGKPIWMYDPSEPSEGKAFSVTQINSMVPENAKIVGDETMLTALQETAGKGSDDDSGTDTEGTGENDTAEQAISFGQRVASFFGNVQNKAAVAKAMAEYKKNPEGAEWMDLIHELDKAIHPLADKTRTVYLARQNAALANADNEAESEAVA